MLSYKNRETFQKKRQSNSLTIDITADCIFACILTATRLKQRKKDILSEALVPRYLLYTVLFHLALMFHTTF